MCWSLHPDLFMIIFASSNRFINLEDISCWHFFIGCASVRCSTVTVREVWSACSERIRAYVSRERPSMFLSVQSQSGGVLLLWLQLQESVIHMWPPEDSCSRTFSFLLSRLTVASYSFSCTLVRYSNSQIACCTVHCGCAAVALIHLFIIHFSINRCTDSCLSDSASDVSPSEKTRDIIWILKAK